MTTIADAVRAHLQTTGLSMRALGLEAGLGERTVAGILSGRTAQPRADVLEALSVRVGIDLAALPKQPTASVADMLRRLDEAPPEDWSSAKVRGAKTALRWYARATGQGPDVTPADRASLRAFLVGATGAQFGLEPNSFGTYASLLGDVADLLASPARKRRIDDVTGVWRDLHRTLKRQKWATWTRLASGAFFVWCSEQGIEPCDVEPAIFERYHEHRLVTGGLRTREEQHRKVAKELCDLWIRMACEPPFLDYRLQIFPNPFVELRDKFGVDEGAIAPLLVEFDAHVAPWARGETARDGRPKAEILAEMDAAGPPSDPKRALLATSRRTADGKRKQSETREPSERMKRLTAAGILAPHERWSDQTLKTARAMVVSLAKALLAETGYLIKTIAEFTDPEVAARAAEALEDWNGGEEAQSSYVESCLKRVKKLAAYVGRPPEEITALGKLSKVFAPTYEGISPRNKEKLKQFTPSRIDAFLAMSGDIVGEAATEIEARRERDRRRKKKPKQRPEYLDVALARQVMLALAHDILVARPPRKSNLLDIDIVRHVRRNPDGLVVIELPPEMVKNETAITIPLGERESRLYDYYVEHARPLLVGDKRSTRLFPSPRPGEGRYTRLPVLLVETIHERVGVRIHLHLYRHLLGWAWLKQDPNKLPAVQKLLGHKRIETTLKFYAELDESLCLQQWHDYVKERQNARERARQQGGGRARLAA